MSAKTSIEWTDASWNPVRGCTKVSEGCRHCWAMRMAARFSKPGMWGHGFAEMVDGEPRWTGRVELIPEMLDLPLRWRAPRRIFLSSFDLFHQALPDEAIDRVVAVMALAPQHTFQVLTKRPQRAFEHQFRWQAGTVDAAIEELLETLPPRATAQWREREKSRGHPYRWPLPNVWLGVSVEGPDQRDRIEILRRTPAVLRFVSFEPLLADLRDMNLSGVAWAIFGGESGPGARPCDVAWIRSGMATCRYYGTRVFVKQLGARPRGVCDWKYHAEHPAQWLDEDGVLSSVSGRPPVDLAHSIEDAWWPCSPRLRDRKGGDPAEWPEDLRVREFPVETA